MTIQSRSAVSRTTHRPSPAKITAGDGSHPPLTKPAAEPGVGECLPGEHAVDSGYASAELLLAARARGITLIAPLLADASRQARTGGYTTDMFTIDWDAAQVTCPEGAVSQYWSPCRQHGRDVIVVQFPGRTCRDCPVRDKCTTATRAGRQLTLRPREIHEAVAAAPAEQDTKAWQRKYAARAGVEGPHGPGHPRHRHPPCPLPRPAQNHPRTQHRRCRDQPHPARRLVDLAAARPHPDQPLPAAPVRAHRMKPNKPTGSAQGEKVEPAMRDYQGLLRGKATEFDRSGVAEVTANDIGDAIPPVASALAALRVVLY